MAEDSELTNITEPMNLVYQLASRTYASGPDLDSAIWEFKSRAGYYAKFSNQTNTSGFISIDGVISNETLPVTVLENANKQTVSDTKYLVLEQSVGGVSEYRVFQVSSILEKSTYDRVQEFKSKRSGLNLYN